MKISSWLFYIETEKDAMHYLDAQGFIVNRSDALPWEGSNGDAMWESNRRAYAFSSRVNKPPVAAAVAECISHVDIARIVDVTPQQPEDGREDA